MPKKEANIVLKKERLRDKYIQVWVTEKEREFIKEKAASCGLSVSEYLRKVSVDGVIILRDFKGIYEINKIGVNINQIARSVNERDVVTERDVEDLRVQYEKLFEVVRDLIMNG